jgi:hypothetical protein
MKQKNPQDKHFDEEAPLPMHMMMMEEAPQPEYATRLRKSAAARSDYYGCFTFYKHISRPLPMGRMEVKPDEGKG